MKQPHKSKFRSLLTFNGNVVVVRDGQKITHVPEDEIEGGVGSYSPVYLNEVFGVGKFFAVIGGKKMWLSIESKGEVRLVGDDRRAQATAFRIEASGAPEGSPKFSFKAAECYMCAAPKGDITIDRRAAQLWEQFTVK